MTNELLTPEQEKDLAQLVLSAAVPWLKTHPWALWLALLVAALFTLSFVVGVAAGYIDGTKLKGVRAQAAYKIARRFGFFFSGAQVDIRELITGQSADAPVSSA